MSEASRKRRTTTVPVTTLEEVPVLTDEERMKLLASLKTAKTDIDAGRGTEYDQKALKDRLLQIHAKGIKGR